MIIRPAKKRNGRTANVFFVYCKPMFIHPGFQSSPCLANVTMITRRTRNKIVASPAASRDNVCKSREFNFVYRFKEDFDLRKGFRDFDRDKRIKKQNNRIETRI